MKNSARFKRSLIATAVASVTFFSLSAIAQEEVITSNTEAVFLEELIVTAQKKSESVQDIPIAIAAFNDEQLNALGVTQSGELGQYVPGLEIGNSSGEGSQLLLFLRGAGLNDLNTNNAGPIGLYSDEVYVSSPALSPFQLFDAERVEILKGPQGTIYGRNTTGGAVKFITKKPTSETKVSGRWRFNNRGKQVVEAAASGALGDNINARVAVAKTHGDGYGRNLQTGEKVNGTDNTAWRALFSVEPNDRTSVLVNLHGAHVDSPNASFSPLGTIDPQTGETCSDSRIANNECANRLGYRSPANELDGSYDGISKINLDSVGGYVQVDYDFNDDVRLTSVTAYDDLERSLPEEADGSPGSLLHTEFGVASQTFTQELRLSGATENTDWLAGVFFLDETLVQNQTIDLLRSYRTLTDGKADLTGTVAGAPILFSRSINEQNLQTIAGYAQLNYFLNDAWSLTFGGRYTQETRGFNANGSLEEPETFGPAPLSIYAFDDLETDSSKFSYRLGAQYRPDSNTLYYGSIATGFKSGGFNGGFLNLDPEVARLQLQPFDPEFVTAYELGIKTDFFDSRMRLNASVFHNDFEDLQVFTLVNNGTLPVLVLDNASNARSSGLEVDFSALITPRLSANLNASFIKSELENFVIESTGQDLSGNRLAQTPETSLSGYFNYEYDLASGAYLSAQAGFAYKDDLFFSTENNPLVGQDAYTLVSTRVAYTNASDVWTLAFFVNNLTDERYLTNVSDTRDITGSYVRTFGSPRTYGVELSLDF